jgi:polar amino acid transport system substrate-binding protein
MTRRHVLLLLGMSAIGIFLLGQSPMSAQEKPLAKKTLYWGADCNGGIPYVMQDPEGVKRDDEPDGPVTGFEADLRDALERELGCRIIFKQLKFDNLFKELEQGNCDFAMNGLEIVPENQARALFSKPYYVYQQQLVIRENEREFSTLEQCVKLELPVGTLSGSAAVRVLQGLKVPDDRIKQYDDQDGPYKDLSLGRGIRAVLLDLPAALYYVAPDPKLRFTSQRVKGLKFTDLPFAEGEYGIAVKTGNDTLAIQLNTALDNLRESGELKRILAKWDLWNVDQYKLYNWQSTEAGTASAWTIERYMPLLIDGAIVTVEITLLGFALAIALGLPIALMQMYGSWPLRSFATVYVEFFRGIPVLLLLYFLYYGLGSFGQEYGIPFLKLDPFPAAVLGFGLNYAAYEAEIYRAGITAVPPGQWEAAASLGMSAPLTFRRIVLPQAIRMILPPMTNDLVALFKDTSVVSIIAVTELSTKYQILTKSGAGYVQVGICTALLYLIMSVPLGHLSRYLERRWGSKA